MQHDMMDCGPSCLSMIAKYYERSYPLQYLRELTYASRNGVTMLGIADAAEAIGFKTLGIRTSFEKLAEKAILPCIIHWRQDHFVVVYKIKAKKTPSGYKGKVYVADPAFGIVEYSVEEFLDAWISTKVDKTDKGMVLMLSPTPDFYEKESVSGEQKSIRWFLQYLRPYKKLLFQIVLGVIFGMVLQLIFPFLNQSMVDVGIMNGDFGFIVLILIFQVVLSISQMLVGFVQSWISLHMNTRINISLISDYLAKLLRLPMNFFDSKNTGDIMQRIGDHGRIQSFLTGNSISIFFSFFNFIIFAGILVWYNMSLLIIFVIGYTLYVLWVISFLRIRKKLDHKRFDKASRNQSSIIQLISGVEEIKLNNCEKRMRWHWETIQAELFDISVKGISVGQIQGAGSFFISNTVNILLSIISAKAVIEGELTLGMMMSISYIIGQLRGPVENFIGFIHSYQDAKISIERLGEVHFMKDEEQEKGTGITELLSSDNSISIDKVSFSYQGPSMPPVLKEISIKIPQNKITAIVGASGSGKTTLMKLLIGNYEPKSGTIKVGETNLSNINPHYWRSECGIVMQDGFIFSKTIAENIAISDEEIDKQKLFYAAKIANIHDFVEERPSGFNTKIGQEGSGLSQGQKQRILIARAIYKDPSYLFFDEATNSLDANNEKTIMENLKQFYEGRTVVIIAHRLSTVRNADQIIVLNNGEVAEQGNHSELIAKKGIYFELVHNQLELGT